MSTDVDHADRVAEFTRALADCERLYREAAKETLRLRATDAKSAEDFRELMVDLHRGLVVKIFVEITQSDWSWNPAERDLASALVAHVWGVQLPPEELRAALDEMVEKAGRLTWDGLVDPFERYPPLRERVADLEAIVVRIANLVAKIDGTAAPAEIKRIEWIRSELRRQLVPLPLDDVDEHDVGPQATAKIIFSEPGIQSETSAAGVKPPPPPPVDLTGDALLEETLHELRALIGLDVIKRDVEELANFLKIQEQRSGYGLPRTPVSLHMVFSGNPGTGKTTVARLIARIFKALGILKSGHLVETDRSGLVAPYAGQTGPKTQRRIDEALDGVLFIDEAYSLVAEGTEDAYGAEALQTLLKRMEDDRDRLVVILAGYPRPMDRLIRTNPGLASRFNRRLDFPDYKPQELAQIFQRMSDQHHYELPTATRLKLLLGFQYLCQRSDERFGNGRLARNVFETTIRRLANRIVAMKNLTKQLLTTVDPADVAMEGVPNEVWAADGEQLRLEIVCPGCKRAARFGPDFLGHTVRCNRCAMKFRADWGEIVS